MAVLQAGKDLGFCPTLCLNPIKQDVFQVSTVSLDTSWRDPAKIEQNGSLDSGAAETLT